MKKYILTFGIALMAIVSFGQTATNSKLGTKSKLSHADSLMCGKEWHVTSVEEWGVVTKPPGEKNKNDMLVMTTDMKFALIIFGEKRMGTWSRSGQYIYFTDENTKKKFSYKVLTVEANKIKVDHFAEEEGHSIFEMEPLK